MFKHRYSLPLLAAIAFGAGNLAVPLPVHADNLLIHRVQQEKGMNLPTRGMSMAQVEKRFGAPAEKLASAGGDAPKHPTINRWRYNGYTVYFERSRVIHSVVDQAPATKS